MEPRRRLTVLLGGFAVSQMLYVAARLRIADHLARGPVTVDELAAETGSRIEPLGRVLRALAGFGVFQMDGAIVSNTPLSDCLRAGADDGLRDLALVYGEEHYHAMSELYQAVKRGGTAFAQAYGRPHFSYLASNPDAAQAYHQASNAGTARMARSLAREYDFGDAAKVVDVGGGTGQVLRAVLAGHPQLSGVLVETAGLVAKARARIHAEVLADRCELEAGDIFSAVPGGGDVYLLGQVLHAVDDHHAVCVLRACERAAAPGGRVLVIERLIPDVAGGADDAQFAAVSDLVALAVSGGRERTRVEIEALLDRAGLGLRRVLPLSSGETVIEAVRPL